MHWSPNLRKLRWIGVLFLVLLSFAGSIRLLGTFLYDYPPAPAKDQIPKDSLIVCLAGGRGRVHAALDLFSEGVGAELFIVGAGPHTNVQTILKNILAAPDAPKISVARMQKVLLEKDSRNTIENAYAVENFLRQNPQVHDVVLITSSYHMRRSLLILQSLLRKEVHVVPYSPPKEPIDAANWWQSFLGIEVTVVEYSKFLLAKILIPNLSYF